MTRPGQTSPLLAPIDGARQIAVPMDQTTPFTHQIRIRPPARRDRAAFLTAVWESRQLHGDWVSPPDTRASYAAYLRRLTSSRYAAFLVEDTRDDGLVGVINVSEIVLGDFQSGYLGYYGFAAKAGLGLMTQGLQAVVRHAFADMGLHRLEANIQPDNAASIALVTRCGFRHEGLSLNYLRIAGVWRDHLRYAITLEDLG